MRIFLITFLVLIQACSSMPEHAGSPYESFSEYRTAVSDGSIASRYSEFFAPSLIADLDLQSPSIQSQLGFSQYMGKELSHYYKSGSGSGCLTVNGVTSDESPMAFYIQFQSINDRWLMSDIDVSLMESVDEYSKEALCPEEVRVE